MSRSFSSTAYPLYAAKNYQELGLTKREAFAMRAMEACIAATGSWGPCTWEEDMDCDEVAKFAYKMADAMLLVRNTQ